MKHLLLLFSIILLIGCKNSKNSPKFMSDVTGEYLFNSKETINISFIKDELMVNWRGKNNIRPLKINDSTFYMKEMNEKLIFITYPKTHIQLAQKREHNGHKIRFIKLKKDDKTPYDYLTENNFEKALAGYRTIIKNNPNSKSIKEADINSLGYRYLKNKKNKQAINIFKLNTELYPKSSNVYDSLGEAYWNDRDTINALKSYKKSLKLNPRNERAQRFIKNYETKND